MPTRKLYIEFDEPVAQGAAIAARYNGMSLSEWINAAARHALDDGYFDVDDEDARPRLARPEVVAVPAALYGEVDMSGWVNGWLDTPAVESSADDETSTAAADGDEPGDAVEPDGGDQPGDQVGEGDDEPVDEVTVLDEHPLVWADAGAADSDGSQDEVPAPEPTTDPGSKASNKAKTRATSKASAASPADAKPKARKKSKASKKSGAAAKPKKVSKTAARSKPKGGLMPKERREAMRLINRRKQPSTGTIATTIGVSRQAALKLLRAMETDGMIEWVGNSKRDPNAYWQPRSD